MSDTKTDPAELGRHDGARARDAKAKRGRQFTPLGACRACGDAFDRHLFKQTLSVEDVATYGTAFIEAALRAD